MDALLSLIITTALLLGSPGPAPLALAATSAAFGIKKGLPFLFGILFGLSFAIVGATLGLATLFNTFPEVRFACQLLGACYITFIAFKIATAPINTTDNNKIPSFQDGFILNLLNPKAYAAFLAIFSQHLLSYSDITLSYIFTGLVCLAVATVVDLLWLFFGGLLKPIFRNPKQARIIRIVFALLMMMAVISTVL